VEHNDGLIYLIQRYGQDTGLEIVTASGLEAVERAREAKPAVILLSADLPGHKGWDVLHALKADCHARHIPVVMYSGMDQRARMLEEGADGCVQMPLVRDELLAVLETLGLMSNLKSVS
jgi:CheY-like chemotaxis protein